MKPGIRLELNDRAGALHELLKWPQIQSPRLVLALLTQPGALPGSALRRREHPRTECSVPAHTPTTVSRRRKPSPSGLRSGEFEARISQEQKIWGSGKEPCQFHLKQVSSICHFFTIHPCLGFQWRRCVVMYDFNFCDNEKERSLMADAVGLRKTSEMLGEEREIPSQSQKDTGCSWPSWGSFYFVFRKIE